MCAASQLPGRGPTDVDVAPVPASKEKNLSISAVTPLHKFNTFTAISLKKPIAQCQAFLLISPPY